MIKTLQRILYWFCSPLRPHRSRTVRYAYPLLAVSLTVMGAAALLSGDDSYIALELEDERVSKGEVVAIDIYAHTPTAVNAIDFTFHYPEGNMSIFSIDTGESVITLWTEQPTATDGEIRFQGGTYRRGFTGEHLIATVKARAEVAGVMEFNIDGARLLSGDGEANQVPVSEQTDKTSKTVYVVDGAVADGEDGAALSGDVSVRIATDVNNDGKVDMSDVSAFMSAWGTTDPTFDFNNDGFVSFTDFGIILADSFFK